VLLGRAGNRAGCRAAGRPSGAQRSSSFGRNEDNTARGRSSAGLPRLPARLAAQPRAELLYL